MIRGRLFYAAMLAGALLLGCEKEEPAAAPSSGMEPSAAQQMEDAAETAKDEAQEAADATADAARAAAEAAQATTQPTTAPISP